MRYFSLVFILPIVFLSGCAHQNAVAPLPGIGATAATRDSISPARHSSRSTASKSRPDGARPEARLAALDGAFYGTTRYGGADDVGIGFPNHSPPAPKKCCTVSLSTTSTAEARLPVSSRATALALRATHGGGTKGVGIFYEIKRDGTLKVLHNFAPPTGSYPVGELFSLGSAFYGVTSNGGAYNLGTVYSITARTLHADAQLWRWNRRRSPGRRSRTAGPPFLRHHVRRRRTQFRHRLRNRTGRQGKGHLQLHLFRRRRRNSGSRNRFAQRRSSTARPSAAASAESFSR